MSNSSSPAIALPLPLCSRRPSGALGLPGTTRSHWRESSPCPARYPCSLPFGPYRPVRFLPSSAARSAPQIGRLGGHLVDPVVPAVTRVAFHPTPADRDLAGQRELDERLPEVAVGHRLVLRVLPTAAEPPLPPPVGEALDDVGRVADHLHPVGRLGREGAQRFERGRDLHALVGRVPLGTAGIGAAGHGPGPATRPGISPARAVGVDDDGAALG